MRAQNAKGKVVVEVIGKGSKSLYYPRHGSPTQIRQEEPTWKSGGGNPKIVLFEGEEILVRVSDALSFMVSAEGVTPIENDVFAGE